MTTAMQPIAGQATLLQVQATRAHRCSTTRSVGTINGPAVSLRGFAMPLREECLWETLTPQRPEAPVLNGEVTVDVCVIGAGITGLSAAIHLLEQGKTVAVVEAHRTGQGGSGRNVGLVNAGLWIPPDDIEAGF